MAEKPHMPTALIVFTVAYIAASCVSAWLTDNSEFVYYIVVMAVLITTVWLVHHRTVLSGPLLWLLSVWGLLHMAGGLVPIPESWPFNGPHSVLYSLWLVPGKLKYDQIVHFYGFGITTWLCWEVLSKSLRVRYEQEISPTTGLAVLCAAAGMGFGALNEMVEFAATRLFENTNVGGYVNTSWDLVFNGFGAAAAAVVIRLWGGRLSTEPS